MKKDEVYSWRLSAELKAALEREARREGVSIAALLERMAVEWLGTGRQQAGGDEQARLHAAAARTFGTLAGGDPSRSREARSRIRRRLAARHRTRHDH